MTAREIQEIMLMFVAAYPSWRPTERTLALYERILEPLPVAAARDAAMRIIRSKREFAPLVGVVWDEAIKILTAAQGAPEISAEDGWYEVNIAIRQVGSYGKPRFSHPVIERAVNAIGWREICLSENIAATRAHFFRVFESFSRRLLEKNSAAFSASQSHELISALQGDAALPAAHVPAGSANDETE